MVQEISIRNYKGFADENMNVCPITVLCGVNSGGKSSFLQALLLGISTLIRKENQGILDLMHLPFGLKLFSFDEILYQDALEEEITVKITTESQEATAIFLPSDDERADNEIKYAVDNKEKFTFGNVWYLGAGRSLAEYQERGTRQNITLGDHLEYLAYILEQGREVSLPIDKKRNLHNQENNFFSIQVNEWLDYIMPGSQVGGYSEGRDNVVSLLFGQNKQSHKDNVGFGLSFTLPILVAGLLAKSGDLLMVENPELHLHPKAQSNMMYFFERIAECGVQVIIETHSDHVINGLRRTVVDDACGLSPKDYLLYFFDSNTNWESIHFDENAELDNWPKDFMEQGEEDLYFIRKARK